MIIDLNKVDSSNYNLKKFNLIIVGGGAARIAIAQSLIGENFSVFFIKLIKK